MDTTKAQKILLGELTLRDLTREELKEYYTVDQTRLVPVYETCLCCGGEKIAGYKKVKLYMALPESEVDKLYRSLHGYSNNP